MNIILLENVEKVGFKDEIVSVKPGFGRNFLIPGGKAILATTSTIKILSEKLKQQERKEKEIIDAANKIAEELATVEIKIKAKVAEDGKKIFVYSTSTVTQLTQLSISPN